MRRSREEWRRLVARWVRSGQTAGTFAAEVGVNANTLQFWKYALARETRAEAPAAVNAIVELRSAVVPSDQRFDLELSTGRRLRIPPSFDADALKRLLAVLETTS
jgi:transposase-like protein